MAPRTAGRRTGGRGSVPLGLIGACHPLPTLAVTSFATAYAVRIGASAGTAAWVAVAALAGQLTVGWVNDVVDAIRDREAGRTEKPLVAGTVSTDQVWTATLIAGVLAVLLSLHLGLRVGLLHLVAIGFAQAYNLRLKGTLASPVPYVVAFGLLPVIVAGAVWNLERGLVAGGAWPPFLHVLAAALLGAAAHAGNTVGDAAADQLTGVRGLPQRLGPASSLLLMAGLVGLASVLLIASALFADLTAARLIGVILLLAGAAAAAAVATRRSAAAAAGPTAWRLTLGSVALVVLGFLLSA